MELVLLLAAVGLATLGLVEAARRMVFWATKPGRSGNLIWIVMVRSADDCEYLIRSAAERIRWMDMDAEGVLVCVNENGEEEINEICERLKSEFPYLTVSNSADLEYNYLKALL